MRAAWVERPNWALNRRLDWVHRLGARLARRTTQHAAKHETYQTRAARIRRFNAHNIQRNAKSDTQHTRLARRTSQHAAKHETYQTRNKKADTVKVPAFLI